MRSIAMKRVSVSIQGQFAADYDMETGEIVRMTFTPILAEDGGARVDCNADDWREELSADAAGLDTRSVDGPFWRAMQAALGTTTRFASMDDQDNDSVVVGPALPIEWTE
jgi:hypothetical protein